MEDLIEVERDGKYVFVKPEELEVGELAEALCRINLKYVFVKPEELEVGELAEALCRINLDSDEFIPDSEIRQGYAAINEAIRRLEVTSTSSKKETTVPIDKSPGI